MVQAHIVFQLGRAGFKVLLLSRAAGLIVFDLLKAKVCLSMVGLRELCESID